MGPVKRSFYAVQKKSYPGAVTLESFRTQCHEQRLDVIPDYAGVHRIVENCFQRFAVLTGHKDLVSLSDTVVNDIVDWHKIRGAALFSPSIGTYHTRLKQISIVPGIPTRNHRSHHYK